MKKDSIQENVIIASLIFLAIICRLATNQLELWNFNALGASALFGGIVIRNKRLAYLLPLLTLFLTDVFFQLFTSIQGFYGFQMIFVYGAFLLITWIGTIIRKVNVLNVLLAAIGTGVLFFLISNFGVWMLSNLYPPTAQGLVASYVAAIPFYRNDLFGSFALNTILGNVFFTGVLFGAWALIKQTTLQSNKQLA
ncbi:hypothetical protein SAMN05518672_107125 [Chitinophaga sp. CF118]|uniref:DUF6580 family putative transport protein n=1 Tax=Chitinophaga sp. CF118 TaxID=1884367 RepID=UPI0008E52F80|nr:DUF6580 family putative transport protein [Chitinophaga sp. CF118]SFE53405.1 hypothetical protein SAMN05518672_107125 [Chitinophaga sp. CF118]